MATYHNELNCNNNKGLHKQKNTSRETLNKSILFLHQIQQNMQLQCTEAMTKK